MAEKMKILIGYDGSDCGEAMLDDLQRAGLPAEAEACVLAIAEVWLPPPPPSAYEIVEQARQVKVPSDFKKVYARGSAALEEAQSLADRAAVRLRTNFPGWKVTAEASYGSPAWELVMKADSWQPDLVTVGSHGRTAIGRLVLGSVSQRVLNEARTSVRVSRGRVEEPDTPVRIVVGVDGSPASEAAVRAVAARNWPLKSEVRVLMVNDPLTPTLFGKLIPPVEEIIEESNQEDREWADKVVTNSAEILSKSELKVTTELRQGNPKQLLVRAAEEWGADCIFVGSVGFSNRFERFVLGSVSAAVAAHAHCSVEVVRTRKTT